MQAASEAAYFIFLTPGIDSIVAGVRRSRYDYFVDIPAGMCALDHMRQNGLSG
jgi:hypothetical protein